MTNDELKAILGDKFLPPSTHEYVLANRRGSIPKQLEGWFRVGEFTNHGEVMIVMARPLPATAPQALPEFAESKPKAKGSLAQRAFAAVRGNK